MLLKIGKWQKADLNCSSWAQRFNLSSEFLSQIHR